MTTKQVFDLAIEAAQSAFDAHATIGNFPAARTAYQFIRSMKADDSPDDNAIWDSLELDPTDWQVFVSVYTCELANLKIGAGVSQEVTK